MPRKRPFPSPALARAVNARRRLVSQLRNLEARIRGLASLPVLTRALRAEIITPADFGQYLIDGGRSADEAAEELNILAHKPNGVPAALLTAEQLYEAEYTATTRESRLRTPRVRTPSLPHHSSPLESMYLPISPRPTAGTQ